MARRLLYVAAAGTGGHIFPGLSIAQSFNQQTNYQVHWIATQQGMENQILANHPYPLLRIAFTGVRQKGWRRLLKLPLELLTCSWRIRQHMKSSKQQFACSLVVMGGYISFPAALAAKSLAIPVLVHEQNAIPGLANSLLCLIANTVCEGFSGAFNNHYLYALFKRRIQFSANPIRAEILNLADKPISQLTNILILGGSLGAIKLNQVLPSGLKAWQDQCRDPLIIQHQCGKNRQQKLQQTYDQLELNAKVTEFIDDMASAYQQADLIIARAGASTLAEIAHLGRPAILIPYPEAVNNHQYHNALWLQQRQVCSILMDQQLTTETLKKALLSIQHQLPQSPQNKTVLNATKKIHRLIEALYES